MKRPVAYVTTFHHAYGLVIVEHDSRHNELRRKVVNRLKAERILSAFRRCKKPVYQHDH